MTDAPDNLSCARFALSEQVPFDPGNVLLDQPKAIRACRELNCGHFQVFHALAKPLVGAIW